METKVNAIVYLNRCGSAQATLVRLPERTATERMCAELFSAGEIRTKHERVLEKLASTPTYELHYSNLDEAIRQLEALTQ
jgi:hypothetical protein